MLKYPNAVMRCLLLSSRPFCRKVRSILIHLAACVFSVKEMAFETTAPLTDEGHAAKALADQAQVGLMKPNLVSALIQRGALR